MCNIVEYFKCHAEIENHIKITVIYINMLTAQKHAIQSAISGLSNKIISYIERNILLLSQFLTDFPGRN